MKRNLNLIVYFLFILTLNAQKSQVVSGNFTATTFNQLVSKIESQTTFRFYFKPVWTDSLVINGSFSNTQISAILDEVLAGTALHYSIKENSIFITQERQILADLPTNFFNTDKTPIDDSIAFDYSDFEHKQKLAKEAEEKLYHIGTKSKNNQGSASIAGIVRDVKTGEPIIGASVFVENPLIGVATDQFGYFSLTLPKGSHVIKINGVGLKNTQRSVMLHGNGKLDIEIEEDIIPLKEVLVESERDLRVTGMQMGMEKLDIRTMKQIPLALGETDILKVVLTLPGVQSVGEGTVGLNVRGGATNQNLILYNDATVYNPSHLFGFFSTFNPDVLKNVELYKSGITAEYGGRLSSVLDVHSREGNLKKIQGSGGISPITGRLSLEGPIIKDRTSFLLGFRSTYSNWVLRKIKSKELGNSTASFYDLNASISHKIDDSNNIYISAYSSQDKFRLKGDTIYHYSDNNASLKWKHLFSSKLYGVLTGTISRYNYSVESNSNPTEAAVLDFSIQQWNAKADFNYFPNSKHTITAGASVLRYNISPGNYTPIGNESQVKLDQIQKEQALESGVYIGENYEITNNLSIYGGLRFSYYQSFGARNVYTYTPGLPRQEGTIQDTILYSRGETIANYYGLEPRLSVRYLISGNTSIKFSYNRMRQYIQMLSNTTAIAPTDIWKLSDTYVQPQIGDQYSIGFYKNLKGNIFETSIEAYYKSMNNTIDYKSGATLLQNHHLETEILNSKGKAYGIEFHLKKSTGKLNGWVSYTYSRSYLKTKGATTTETVNDGQYYPSNYDKPHSFNFIGNYKFSRRFNFSLNTVYSTGRPITLPIAKYDLDGTQRIYYSNRNAYRIPDYFRIDVSINVEGNHKIKKLAHSSWTFAVYNLTGRSNAYSVYFTSENGIIKGYKLSVFAKAIPTVTYNFKF